MALTKKTPDLSLDKAKKSKLVKQQGILPGYEHTTDPPAKPIKPVRNLKRPKADE